MVIVCDCIYKAHRFPFESPEYNICGILKATWQKQLLIGRNISAGIENELGMRCEVSIDGPKAVDSAALKIAFQMD